MDRGVADIARMLEVDLQLVKQWAHVFKEVLTPAANPVKGLPRRFSESDAVALAYVADHWEIDCDTDELLDKLKEGSHNTPLALDRVYAHTPIFQDPPSDLDETWQHGMLLNGAGTGEFLETARNYRQAAEAALAAALKQYEVWEWGHPVLYLYRHTLELYLKIIGEIEEPTHSLERCVLLVEDLHKKRIASPLREWILEFSKLDPNGMTFRYADSRAADTLKYADHWIDFHQLRFALGRVFEYIDHAILGHGSHRKQAANSTSNAP